MKGLKYFKQADIYKNYNGNNVINLNENKAWSYSWWLYYTKLDSGLTVFNSSYYSSSTVKHQNQCKSLLDYKFDLNLRNTTSSLDKPHQVKNDLLEAIKELNRQINKPRTRKSTNERRLNEITEIEDNLQVLQDNNFFQG